MRARSLSLIQYGFLRSTNQKSGIRSRDNNSKNLIGCYLLQRRTTNVCFWRCCARKKPVFSVRSMTKFPLIFDLLKRSRCEKNVHFLIHKGHFFKFGSNTDQRGFKITLLWRLWKEQNTILKCDITPMPDKHCKIDRN